mgnify:CR=1 FL=1
MVDWVIVFATGSAASNDITLISIALLLNPRLPKPTFLCLRRMLTRCDPQHRFDLLCQRDGGTINYIFILFDEGDYETGRRLLSGMVNLSSQPSGISMVSMYTIENNKDLKLKNGPWSGSSRTIESRVGRCVAPHLFTLIIQKNLPQPTNTGKNFTPGEGRGKIVKFLYEKNLIIFK